MILRILAGSMVALGLGMAAENAQAAQTFICEDGRLLTVKLSDLARLKREDACIAGYYGTTVQLVPLPVKRPVPPLAGELKGAVSKVPARREIGVIAHVNTDYRRVRIINARPGASGWYNHSR